MKFGILILGGFAGTLILSALMALSRPLGLSRVDLPFILGTFVTPNRNKAPWVGFFIHLFIGWIFALLYGAVFEVFDIKTWWFGMIIGFFHGVFVLSIGLEILGFLHPRMANPSRGPSPTRQLQTPGFFALNYGRWTPVITIISHIIFGGILGLFYHL